MKGVIIAAGRGLRMGRLTESRPKCLLPIAGRPLIEYTIENLRLAGCSQIIVIVGYKAGAVDVRNVQYVLNADFENNNILHSFMKASENLVGPIIASYSDIWVEPWIFRSLVETPGDIVLAVDRDWQPYYEGRTQHTVSEAENVYFDRNGSVVRLGKNLDPDVGGELTCGEFLGLWRMSAAGTEDFCAEFVRLQGQLGPSSRFQQSAHWSNAYITDFVQELVDRGRTVKCAAIERGWAELDTEEDFGRLMDIAERQRLTTLLEVA